MSERPFRVLGIQQIAVGGTDKGRLRRLWVDTFGLQVVGDYRSERENVDEDIAILGSGPFKVEVDLMQPIDPEKKPRVDTPPLNHIGLWVDDIDAARRLSGLLVEATRALLHRKLPAHLLVIGNGEFSALSGLPEANYTRLPWVGHDQIPALIGRFDALPLTYPPDVPCYFSPLKLAEAMACGAVPVVPDLGDLARTVAHERTGLVYPAGDPDALVSAVESLIEDPSLKAGLAAAAAQAALEWGWDRIALRILDHFGLSLLRSA